jgi:hypothetical protein
MSVGMNSLRTFLTASLCVALPSLAWTHHSGAMFDRSKTATITGTVTEFNWTNPHSSIKVEVTADGKAESWAIEMNSPNNLVREGWKRTTLKAGDKVTLTINPLRDGKPGGWYLGIKLPDGQQLGTTSPPPGT